MCPASGLATLGSCLLRSDTATVAPIIEDVNVDEEEGVVADEHCLSYTEKVAEIVEEASVAFEPVYAAACGVLQQVTECTTRNFRNTVFSPNHHPVVTATRDYVLGGGLLQQEVVAAKLCPYSGLCGSCNKHLINAASIKPPSVKSSKIFKCVYTVPNCCDRCAGVVRNYDKSTSRKCVVYLNAVEWTVIEEARLRGWACKADPQSRIVSILTSDPDYDTEQMEHYRNIAISIIVPTVDALMAVREGDFFWFSGRRFIRRASEWELISSYDLFDEDDLDEYASKAFARSLKSAADLKALVAPFEKVMPSSSPALPCNALDKAQNSLVPDGDALRARCITVASAVLKANPGVKTKLKGDKTVLKSPYSHGPLLNVKPVDGNSVVNTDRLGPSQIGPAFAMPLVWDTNDANAMQSAINLRTLTEFKHDVKSDVYHRFILGAVAMCKLWFTDENIREADALFYWDANKPKSWTWEKFIGTLKALDEKHELGMTEVILKLEVGYKQGKPPRMIQNEGPERCLRNLRIIFICEYIIFHKIGSDLCIKNRDKKDVLDALCSEWSKVELNPAKTAAYYSDKNCREEFATVGIDAQAFDFSCAFVPRKTEEDSDEGLLVAEIMILKKIINVLSIGGNEKGWVSQMIAERTNKHNKAFFTLGKRSVTSMRGLLQTRKNRNSGDRGTTVLNWIVEFLATLAVFFRRPADIIQDLVTSILEWDTVSKQYVTKKRCAEGEVPCVNKVRWYQTNAQRKILDKNGVEQFYFIKSPFKGLFEGDDGLLRLIKWVTQYRNLWESGYASLGLKCTLEISTPNQWSVIEVVGTHILINKSGRTEYDESYGGVFCPLVNKAILKSSFTFSDQELSIVAASAFESRRLQFRGKLSWAEDYFTQLRDLWVLRGGAVNKDLFDVYKGYGTNDYKCAVPDCLQKRLLMLSTGSVFDPKFDSTQLGFQLQIEADVPSIELLLPSGFRNYIRGLAGIESPTIVNSPLLDDLIKREGGTGVFMPRNDSECLSPSEAGTHISYGKISEI